LTGLSQAFIGLGWFFHGQLLMDSGTKALQERRETERKRSTDPLLLMGDCPVFKNLTISEAIL
jgi:hypothetical protein